MPGTSDLIAISSSLFAFKPRQVLLLEQQQHRSLAVPPQMAKGRPEKSPQLKPEDESVLIFSVALWLENKGFSKVLKRFLSAAQIEDDTWKTKALNLNEIFSKYQEICTSDPEEVKSQKKQEEQVDGTLETNGDANCAAPQQIKSKNKKKKGKGDSTVTETGKISEGTTINGKRNESNEHDKEDPSYKACDGLRHKDEKPIASEEFKGEEVSELTVDQSSKKKKYKKKKSKSALESLDADEKQVDVIPEPTESKHQVLLSKSSAAEVLDAETIPEKKSKKKSVEAAENGVNESKKASKKRKRMTTNDNEDLPGEEVEVKESKPDKSKGLEVGKDVTPQIARKQNKEENFIARQVGSQDLSTNQTDESTKSTINGNGVDKLGDQKPAKRQRNDSAEPKAVKSFQRVKIDEVEFVDERLQDNSYWAKDGAETGYGAKAQEVLGQVKGRNFRHEKTKKKRGSYRGGQIDVQSHSIKFNYTDEE